MCIAGEAGNRRELAGFLREDFEMRILAADMSGVAGDFDGERIINAFSDDVAEVIGWNEHLAGLLDLHLVVGVADRHL